MSDTEDSCINLDAENLLIVEEKESFNCVKIIQCNSPVVICEVY